LSAEWSPTYLDYAVALLVFYFLDAEEQLILKKWKLNLTKYVFPGVRKNMKYAKLARINRNHETSVRNIGL
jgi:hypothetical protein